MTIRLLSIFMLSFLFLFFSTCKKSTNPIATHGNLALINGTLIDGTGGNPISKAAIIIEKDLITAVGKLSEMEPPPDAEIIDVKGATILPGFFNTHVHGGYSEYNLQTWAQSGVTTVRDVGANPKNNLFYHRDRLLKNISNARLIAAGPMLTAPEGYPIAIFNSPVGFELFSVEDARQKGEQLFDDGADVIKLTIESGALWNQKVPYLSHEVASEVVKVTHERGSKVTVHITVSQDLERALNAGVDDIAHMAVDTVPDKLIQRMVNENVYWVPTLELWKCTGSGNIAISNLRKFVNAGGKVALGTDFEGYTCDWDLGMPMTEIKAMQEAGMTPSQIIVAATKHGAYVCNLEDELGTLEAGKIADVIVVDGNPLEDMDNLMNIRMVIHSGDIIRDGKKSK